MLLHNLLNEDKASDDFNYMLNIIDTGKDHPGIIYNVISTLLRERTKDVVKSMIAEHLDQIIDYLSKHWTTGEPHRVGYDALYLVNTVFAIVNLGNLYNQKLINLLEPAKIDIIRALLIEIQDQYYIRALTYVQKLEAMHLKWPEIYVMSKSLNAPGTIKSLNESPPPQDEFGKPPTKLDPRVPRLLNALDSWLYNTSQDESLELECFEEGVPWILYKLGLLAEEDLVPKRDYLVKSYKDLLMKMVLMAVRNSNQFDESSVGRHRGLALMMTGLRALGANWPELNIVQRSLDHDAQQNPEQLDEVKGPSNNAHDILARILYKLENQDYISAMYRISEFVSYLIKPIDAREKLNPYKQPIIKTLLEILAGRYDDPDNVDFVDEILQGLKELGVTWPELGIIKASVDHELTQKKINESNKLRESDWDKSKQEHHNRRLEEILGVIRDNIAIKSLRPGHIWNAISDLCLLGIAKDKIGELLTPFKDQIISNFTKNWYSHNESEYTQLMDTNSLLSTIAIMHNSAGILWPQLIDLMEKNKYKIIKFVLTQFKYAEYSRLGYSLDYLRSLNLKWPEIDVIAKSLDAVINPPRTESLTEAEPFLYNNKQDFLRKLQIYLDAGYTETAINTLSTVDVDTMPEIKTILDRHIEDILRLMEKFFRSRDWATLIRMIGVVTRFGIEFPELDNFINNRKTYIIKKFIEDLKDGVFGRTVFQITALQKGGITWPELAIIKKSAEHEHNKRIASRTDEAQRPKSLGRSVSARRKIELLTNLDHGEFILTTIEEIAKSRLNCSNCPELAKVLNDTKATLLLKFDSCIGFKFFQKVKEAITALQKIGVNWPQLATFFEDRKKYLIKSILSDFRDLRIIDVLYAIDQLKKAGIQWPELEVIKKSADHVYDERDKKFNVGNLEESVVDTLTVTQRDEILDAIAKNAGNFLIRIDLDDLAKIKVTVQDWPELNAILEDYKPEILNNIKTQWDVTRYESAVAILRSLVALGIKWSELREFMRIKKPETIKRLLLDIRDGEYDIVLDDIDKLYRAGCNWSELKIIEHSAEYEYDRERHTDAEIDQLAPPVDDYDEELDESTVSSLSANDKKKLIVRLRYYAGISDLNNVLIDIVNTNITVGEWPELFELLEYKKTNILRDLDDRWCYGGGYLTVTQTIDYLKAIGIDWPEIANFAEDRKRKTIQQLLTDMKVGDYEIAQDIIYALYRAGIKWPELAIIEKSIAHEFKALRLS